MARIAGAPYPVIRCSRCLNSNFLPPLPFIIGAMKYAVMRGADENHPLVTDLATEVTGLGKAQVVRVAWRSDTDETWLAARP